MELLLRVESLRVVSERGVRAIQIYFAEWRAGSTGQAQELQGLARARLEIYGGLIMGPRLPRGSGSVK